MLGYRRKCNTLKYQVSIDHRMNRHFALKANRIGTSKEYTTNALKRCSILDTQNLIQMLSRAPVTLRYFTSEARNSQTSTKDLNGKLTEQELLERMNTLGTVPFRKITVADVLRPGRKPSLATCLQTCRSNFF